MATDLGGQRIIVRVPGAPSFVSPPRLAGTGHAPVLAGSPRAPHLRAAMQTFFLTCAILGGGILIVQLLLGVLGIVLRVERDEARVAVRE